MQPVCSTKFVLARASALHGAKLFAKLWCSTPAAPHPAFFRSSALKRRLGSTLTHTCRPQQTSRSTPPRVIVRTRLIPVYATPLVPRPGFLSKARVVQVATGPRGWLAETIRTIGGTSGSFCWSPMQSVAESSRRLASSIWSLIEVAISYHTKVAICVSHDTG